MITVLAIASGFILDLIFGDPHWLPHPICLIGNLIAYMEKFLRKIFGSNEENLLVGGLVLVLTVTAVSFFVPYLILKWAVSVNPLFAYLLETIMFYQIFATKCLENESMKVYKELKNGD